MIELLCGRKQAGLRFEAVSSETFLEGMERQVWACLDANLYGYLKRLKITVARTFFHSEARIVVSAAPRVLWRLRETWNQTDLASWTEHTPHKAR